MSEIVVVQNPTTRVIQTLQPGIVDVIAAQAARDAAAISAATALGSLPTYSAAPPASPVGGQIWIDSNSGSIFTWVMDGTSNQWVETGASVQVGSATTAAAAAAAASAAQASHIYAGSYTVAPTTRPSGSARQSGDEYFNSVSNLTFRWNGASWVASDINTANLAASGGSSTIGHIDAGANTTARTMQAVLRDRKSVLGWTGVGNDGVTECYTGLLNAWNDARAGGFDLWAPAGTYLVNNNNFPFRQGGAPTTLLDCNNVTLYCEGPATIFKTVSIIGADVFNFNGLKNFHVKGFPTLTATVSGSASGSNGVSITNGWDNITLQVKCLNLGSVDKGTFIDGGRALTVQNGLTANECGTLKADVIAVGCTEGFGFEPDLVASSTKKTCVVVDLIAENCYIAVKHVAVSASAAIPAGANSGVTVRATSINCQHDVVVQRAHGINIDCNVVTTKTAAARRLNPAGVTWTTTDSIVDALLCNYAKNSVIKVHGYKGGCDYKARIGASAPGASGLSGATQWSDITLDIGGTSVTQDILEMNVAGDTMANSTLAVTNVTATVIPAALSAATLLNRLRIGAQYTGSFTGSLTGCTTVPTGAFKWSLEGDVVTMHIPGLNGTSNLNTAQITGLPADIWPAVSQGVLVISTDNGVTTVGRMNIYSNGTIDLYNGLTTGIFTASGAKGVQFSTVTYRRGG